MKGNENASKTVKENSEKTVREMSFTSGKTVRKTTGNPTKNSKKTVRPTEELKALLRTFSKKADKNKTPDELIKETEALLDFTAKTNKESAEILRKSDLEWKKTLEVINK